MIWLVLAGILTGIDLGIKYYIRLNKTQDCHEPILNAKVIITHFRNKGAMLGFLKNKAKLLLGISLICIGAILGMLLTVCGQKGNCLLKAGLTLLLGGAGSNVAERITGDGVTDYFKLNFGPKKLRHIVFNIGDFLIFIGAPLAAIGSMIRHE